ncbi:hypothetical protein FRC04_010499 [Tulasnella sp. 424]|nr:hypothetical protein FRC04_010499 [Tulasnella sp. 424]
MSNSSFALEAFIATSPAYQYVVGETKMMLVVPLPGVDDDSLLRAVAGSAWVLYDWLITLGQERKQSKAWKSKFLYAVIRYPGLAIITFNVVVIIRTNWSATFCYVYLYMTVVIAIAQMWAAQGALLLRLYVM